MIRKALVVLSLVVSGCAMTSPEQAYLSQEFIYNLPSNPWSQEPLSALQQVTISHGKTASKFQAVLALKPGSAKIVLLDMTGRRAMDINWTRDGLETKTATWLPQNVTAPDILAHIVLAFWPIESAKLGLPITGQMTTNGNNRSITSEGRKLIEIRSDSQNPWVSKTEILHVNNGMKLTISSSLLAVEK